ncbi:MAG TPA: hypothetical protein VFY98_08530 [Intrasporangium sp.]|nr:hypothetical protein [Intrasporangium sp.]
MDGDPVDGQPCGDGLERERAATRCAEQVRPTPCRVDDGYEVVYLALQRIRRGVAAVATPPPAIRDDGERLPQLGAEGEVHGAVIPLGATHQGHKRAVPAQRHTTYPVCR